MKVVARTEGKTYTPVAAILLYGDNLNSTAFATEHRVTNEGGRPVIQAGTVLDAGDLSRVLTALVPSRKMAFLDSKLLAWSELGMVWWVPPAQRRIWFKAKGENDLGEVNGLVWHPGLVFAVSDGAWKVFAVKGDQRPCHDTELWVAPYYNVSSNGAICVGNVKLPEEMVQRQMGAFEDAFFNTNFTHANVHRAKDITRHREGLKGLWQSRLNVPGRRFPESTLVRSKLTLAGLVERMG